MVAIASYIPTCNDRMLFKIDNGSDFLAMLVLSVVSRSGAIQNNKETAPRTALIRSGFSSTLYTAERYQDPSIQSGIYIQTSYLTYLTRAASALHYFRIFITKR